MLRLSLGALALVAALTVPFAASAQSAPAPGAAPAAGQAAPPAGAPRHHRHGNRYMRAMRGLDLSDAQKQQIRGIMRSTRQANLNNGQPVDPQTRKQNAVAMRQQIEQVLTDTQRAQLHANLRAQRRADQTAPGAAPQQPQQPQ